ncbi:branched-chain amino acid ABC transporter permease [Chelatococcus reniformis]|uniref:Branched-chain amino acid ABC transporter permease n=1 Tax=Chelatococcus reniformis TaxID=1494448 RepID=A0A916TX04_9HYPH|nr:branched-chain amino acid ABC transporter permease [Chelatococcus reniformis]GGC49208.1 branched-chain amino acid ABC transporter permease [Chelatococcus reniformis]
MTAPADRHSWLVLALLLVLAALPLLAPGYYVQFATKILLMGIAAMALNLVVGFGGLVSLCHGAFFGLAGYVLALTAPRYDPAALWWSLPFAVAAVALVALVIGALSLRTRGLYFIMVTLAFGEMLFYLFQDAGFAGGSDGTFIHYKPELAVAGLTLVDLEAPAQFFWLVLALAAGVILLLRHLLAAPFGRALRAARDNERRARALGFPIYRLQLGAFVLSGALTALAGYFAAAQFGFVAPQMLGWHLSAILLVMVVLGGLRTVAGPLLGAAALMGLEEVLKLATEHWKLVEGLAIIGIVLVSPAGLRRLATAAFGASASGGEHLAAPPRSTAEDTTATDRSIRHA